MGNEAMTFAGEAIFSLFIILCIVAGIFVIVKNLLKIASIESKPKVHHETIFEGGTFENEVFIGCYLEGCTLKHCLLVGCHVTGCETEGCTRCPSGINAPTKR